MAFHPLVPLKEFSPDSTDMSCWAEFHRTTFGHTLAPLSKRPALPCAPHWNACLATLSWCQFFMPCSLLGSENLPVPLPSHPVHPLAHCKCYLFQEAFPEHLHPDYHRSPLTHAHVSSPHFSSTALYRGGRTEMYSYCFYLMTICLRTR